eukprot:11665650-Karenia_brevis.AAC.1
MHDGIERSHDPRVPPDAICYSNGCHRAPALLSACHCISTHGPEIADKGWRVPYPLYAICGSRPYPCLYKAFALLLTLLSWLTLVALILAPWILFLMVPVALLFPPV